MAYGQRGVLTDRDFASQLNRATCLSLLLNSIAVWNTRYMEAALNHLRASGYPVQDSDLEHLSPITSAHIIWICRPPKSGTGNGVPYGQRLRCSNEADERRSVVDIPHFWAF